jgi:alkanesulfonate monooxygenase SsuD/methylene tetrahydromethanopterin reductase-like flavin-dependent oxidoreductase (luciferase family)
MDLGRIGIWTYHLNYQPASKVRDVAAELEELGYGALWIGESVYREPLTHAGFLLSATNRMVIATGIANIWARDPFTMTAAQLTLSEAYPDRFLLGLGVSHARLVEGIRGHQYQRPLTAMRRYLDGMDEAAYAIGPRSRWPRHHVCSPPLGLGCWPWPLSGRGALTRISSRLTTQRRLAALSVLAGGSCQSRPWSWKQILTKLGRSHGVTSPDTSTCRTTPTTGVA